MSAISASYAFHNYNQHIRAKAAAEARKALLARLFKRAERVRTVAGLIGICACAAFLLSFCELLAAAFVGAPVGLESIAPSVASGLIAFIAGAVFDRAHLM